LFFEGFELVFLRARAPRLAARKREGATMTKEWREREEGRGRKRESVPRARISLSLALDRRGRTNQEKEKKRAKKKKGRRFSLPFPLSFPACEPQDEHKSKRLLLPPAAAPWRWRGRAGEERA
jgi:hypothetical protein